MRLKVAIVYNQPVPGHNHLTGEEKAELGVLDEVKAVYQSLVELGHTVTRVPLVPPLEQARKKLKALKADVVFNLFEGFDGFPESEAVVADILAETGLPYTGCPGSALSIALDKAGVKAILKVAGIATPGWQVMTLDNLKEFKLSFPCIVKPGGEDASHGLSADSVVKDRISLRKQVESISETYGGKALVEEFVGGREFNASVIGNSELTVLPISEIAYSMPAGMPNILTFSSKWDPQSIDYDCTKVTCPAKIDAKLKQQIIDTTLSTFKLTGCRGYARVDLRLDNEGRIQVIEINPNPDISPDAGAARQAKAAGMSYSQFIEKILLLAFERAN